MCLFYTDQCYVTLWNPSIGLEFEKSPALDCFDDESMIMYHGFGYDHINDKYKVLVVVRRSLNERMTRMYTFGANSWTTILNFPFDPTRWVGKFVSGTLNWVFKRGVSPNQSVILSFDLIKETYKEVLLPEHDYVEVCDPIPMLGVSTLAQLI